MEQCFGCIGMLFGSRRRKRRLRYLVNYKDGEDQHAGIEFENLMLDEDDKPNYGTDMQVISQEEREYVSKRQYDKIIEAQRKVDEQIDKQMFEEEELLKIEEEAYYEAQKEAARAASMTLSLKERSADLASASTSTDNRHSLTLEEVEDDFEDFLEEVRSRSVAFRSQYAHKQAGETVSTSSNNSPPLFDRGGDGMSSEDEYLSNENSAMRGDGKDRLEWDNYTSGVSEFPSANVAKKIKSHSPLEERLDPVGLGSNNNNKLSSKSRKSPTPTEEASDKRLDAERMFSITDDEDMGDFVHA